MRVRFALGSALVLVAAAAVARVPERGLLENQQYETVVERNAKGACVACHRETDSPTMHDTGTVTLTCPDCHGGDDRAAVPDECRRADLDWCKDDTGACDDAKRRSHVAPLHPERWSETGGNPKRTYTALNEESVEFIRFMNPGDLRVARDVCGDVGCHASEVNRVGLGMMTHGAMLWGAALYNNGSFPLKNAQFGEAYACDTTPTTLAGDATPPSSSAGGGAPAPRPATPCDGVAQRLQTIDPPTDVETARHGVLPFLDPLPRFEIAQMGNILRVFERGDDRLSPRGLGTLNRTDPVFQGLQRTRLLDPNLSFLGTNDGPGDYRSSGCTACHVVYANDRDAFHSGPYAARGHDGTSATKDPTICRDEPGHPIAHRFTRSIPSSQCVACHMHPGTSFANTYFGYTWWDNETHGEHMYPAREQHPTPEQEFLASSRNPEGSAIRGLWGDLYPDEQSHAGDALGADFLAQTSSLNDKLRLTKFADFHGHGWMFRAVFKHDRKGNLLDAAGRVVEHPTEQSTSDAVAGTRLGKPGVPVHLKDIHLEKRMHCVDCHFEQDVHGNGKLYGEARNAVEIECVDCHGSTRDVATLRTSGPAAPPNGTDLSVKRTPFGDPVFEWRNGGLVQHSMVERTRSWEVPQVLHSITPGSRHYNPLAALAKTIRRDGTTWGTVPRDAPDVRAHDGKTPAWGERPAFPTAPASETLAHRDDAMACYTCHTSWMTSCFGCHLPMRANQRRPLLHFEGDVERNWTQYNYQVLRDDVFMLGHDGTVKRNRIAPVRSSSAVVVGSQNLNREWLYSQQQTISAEGYAGQAFNPHYPHAVRKTETKTCTDCHLSERGDNNAWMAQVLLQGTGFVNFLGRYVWVAEEDHGLEAVVVTEQDEPQAVIGSHLHALAYPDRYRAHQERGYLLPGSPMFEHPGNDVLTPWSKEHVQSLQLRGEYLYSANGPGGLRVYDVADIDNKKIAERITTSVISPLGQRLYLDTPDAAAVVSPSTLAVDPTRPHLDDNEECAVHPLYGYLYVLDRVEGLILTGASTLLDGNPDNNVLARAELDDGSDRFNCDGALDGVSGGTIAGHFLYAVTPRGLVIVDIDTPTAPRIAATVPLRDARAVAVQFRYAFVAHAEGLASVDVTDPSAPRVVANVPLDDARDVYIARTYAYVAGGAKGLVIVDVERPEAPVVDDVYDAEGRINDTRAVKVGMTNASLFAYLADGKNGLRIVQLLTPNTPGYTGFSPRPQPRLDGNGLIATYPTRGPAVALSRGLDRDRAVDESGNQLAVFGRRGARPLARSEQRRLFLRRAEDGHCAASVRSRAEADRPCRETPAAPEDRHRQCRYTPTDPELGDLECLYTVPDVRTAADVARFPTHR
jgi:hypothetical protein